jgi:hypothetical protein
MINAMANNLFEKGFNHVEDQSVAKIRNIIYDCNTLTDMAGVIFEFLKMVKNHEKNRVDVGNGKNGGELKCGSSSSTPKEEAKDKKKGDTLSVKQEETRKSVVNKVSEASGISNEHRSAFSFKFPSAFVPSSSSSSSHSLSSVSTTSSSSYHYPRCVTSSFTSPSSSSCESNPFAPSASKCLNDKCDIVNDMKRNKNSNDHVVNGTDNSNVKCKCKFSYSYRSYNRMCCFSSYAKMMQSLYYESYYYFNYYKWLNSGWCMK